ncbi:hypothetical protein MKW94_012577 [Papaver nudicaule]|uniref:Uncharacterized protein n=1 Tax=Papaver nudicaule TaxID=74823 RepID=A0AA41W2C1_PAPNU|nr:hypothetical protein [Papaver nudicaule]
MKQGSEKGGNGKSSYQLIEGTKKSKKSVSGMDGEPKKGGYGGKFTWSGQGVAADFFGELTVDEKDPNYQDPQDN